MNRDLASLTEDVSLKEAAEILSWRSLSGLPVVDRDNKVIGFISEKDIISSIFPEQVNPESSDVVGLVGLSQVVKKLGQKGQAKVKDFMTRDPVCVKEEDSALDVARLMLNKNIDRLPVTRNKMLIGIVDRANLSRILLEESIEKEQ